MRCLLILSLLLALVAPVRATDDPLTAFYQHLARWHAVSGTTPFIALTSHGPQHALAPNMPFFFVVDLDAPAEIRDYMGGLIAPISPDGKVGDPILIVQSRCQSFAIGDLPSITAGFSCDADAEGHPVIALNKDNILPLPAGRYCALFIQLVPSDNTNKQQFVSANTKIVYYWEFAIREGGENLFDVAYALPSPAPQSTPLPKWLEF